MTTTLVEAVISEVHATTGLQLTTIGTGGNCTAMTATTETGHEVLLTDVDGQLPTTEDPVILGVYKSDGQVVLIDRAPSTLTCATPILGALGRIPHHSKHFDNYGVVYCDSCPSAVSFSTALGQI